MKLKRFLQIFGGIAVMLTLFPFIAVDYWWIRVFDFPHFQLTALTLLAILAYFIRFDIKEKKDYVFMSVLIACFLFQFSKIYPYTGLAKYEVLQATDVRPESKISLFVANVLQTNDKYDKLIQQIEDNGFDVVVLTETNRRWTNALSKKLDPKFPYQVKFPLENTYGLLLYSKYKLIDPKVQFLVDDSIPSIESRILLPSQDTIQLYAIHPTPPMPQHNPVSTDRDAELMKVALKSMNSDLPFIVVGDFNDVAWSQSTRQFQKVSGLLDMRKGRGFFNTFHAKNFLMRWPLDHIFVSEEFRVINLGRGKSIDSDHFPFYAALSFEPEGAALQKAPPPEKEDIEKALEQIQEEMEEEREGS